MTIFKYLLLALFISLPFNGFAEPGSGLPEKRPWGAKLPAYQASDKDKNADGFPAFTQAAELTLSQALTLVLAQNPELAAFSWEVKAHQSLVRQAALLPNPEIELGVENILGEDETCSFKSAETSLRLSQLIELGGKRASRRQIADLERDLAGWNYETTRLDILAAANKAFFELLSAQEWMQLGQENLQLAEEVFNTVNIRVQAGKASPLEKSRALIAVSKNRIALNNYERKLEAARHNLASTWGSTKPHFAKAVGNLEKISKPPSLTSIALRLTKNPEIARQQTEIELQNAKLSMAKSLAVPDVNVGVGVKRHEEIDDYTFLFGVSMALPVFDRNQGGISAAKAEVSTKKSKNRTIEVAIKTDLSQNYEDLQAAYTEASSLQDRILPVAKETFEAINWGYRQGQFEFLDVLDAQRTLIELREQLIDSLQGYHAKKISIERLIGQEITQIKDATL
ncbi:MAG: TolC family protein [Pseudomonadota bacterium]|nr:TolC family protein [Pseudomonadota bacterium]